MIILMTVHVSNTIRLNNWFVNCISDDKAMHELAELNAKIDKYSMLIVETEKSLHQATVEHHILESNLKSLNRDYENQVRNKVAQENQILELLQEQVTTDQANKKRCRSIRDLQNKRRDMELMMNNTEAQLSEILFEMEKLKGISARSRDYADDLIVRFFWLNTNEVNTKVNILTFDGHINK